MSDNMESSKVSAPGDTADMPEDEISFFLDSEDSRVRIISMIPVLEKDMRSYMERVLNRMNLTFMQSMVAGYVALKRVSFPEKIITSRELEQKFEVSNPTMSGILKRLEQKGIIERIPGKKDKREKEIRASSMGESIFKNAMQVHSESLDRMFQGFSEMELEEFSNLLNKLYSNLKNNLIPEVQMINHMQLRAAPTDDNEAYVNKEN